MIGKTHKSATALFFALGISTGTITGTLPLFSFTLGCLYGTIIPDMDAVNFSTARSNLLLSKMIFDCIKDMVPDKIKTKYFKHRGIMHNPVIPLLLSISLLFPIPFSVKMALLGISCGWLSHILLDKLQIITKCKSGGFLDNIVRCLLWVSSFYFLITYSVKEAALWIS